MLRLCQTLLLRHYQLPRVTSDVMMTKSDASPIVAAESARLAMVHAIAVPVRTGGDDVQDMVDVASGMAVVHEPPR